MWDTRQQVWSCRRHLGAWACLLACWLAAVVGLILFHCWLYVPVCGGCLSQVMLYSLCTLLFPPRSLHSTRMSGGAHPQSHMHACRLALARHHAFPVDTHIHRLAERWGLSSGKSVEQTEADLKALLPPETWWVVPWVGRGTCACRHARERMQGMPGEWIA